MKLYFTHTHTHTHTQGEQGGEQRRDTGAVLLPGCGTPCPAPLQLQCPHVAWIQHTPVRW